MAKSFTEAELRLDLKFINAQRAKKEAEEVKKRMEGVREEAERANKLRAQQEIQAKRIMQYNTAMAKKQASLDKAKARELKKAVKQVSLLAKGWQHFKNIFSRVALALTAFVIIRTLQKMTIGFVKAILDANKVLEVMGEQLDVLYKYGTKTERVFEFLKEYAITTPFQIQDLIKTTVALKAFNIVVEKNMKAVGDWASAIDKAADETALAYAKIIAGSPRTRLLLTTRGIAMAEFMRELERTGNRAIALFNITQSKFGGMAERMASTMQGLYSNIKDILFLIAEQLGKPLFEAIKKDLETFHQKLREIYEDKQMVRELGDVFRSLYDSIKAVGAAISATENALVYLMEVHTEYKAKALVHPETGMVAVGAARLEAIPEALYDARQAAEEYRETEMFPEAPAFPQIFRAKDVKKRLAELKRVERLYGVLYTYGIKLADQDIKAVFYLRQSIVHYEELLGYIEKEREAKELMDQIEDSRQITSVKALQSIKLAGEIESKLIEDVFKHWKLQFEQGKLQDKQLVAYAHIKSLYEASLNPIKALTDFLDVAKNRMQILETGTEEFDANMKEAVATAKALNAEFKKLEDRAKKAADEAATLEISRESLNLREKLLKEDKKLEQIRIKLNHWQTKLQQLVTDHISDKKEALELDEKRIEAQEKLNQLRKEAGKEIERIIKSERSALMNEMLQLDKEIGNWQVKLAQAFVGGLTAGMTNFIDYLLWGYGEASLDLDKRIADLQTELRIEQGIEEQLTREESLQREITELQSQRANLLMEEIKNAGQRFIKALINTAVQLGAQIIMRKILKKYLTDEISQEKQKTDELREQFALTMGINAVLGNWVGVGAGGIAYGAGMALTQAQHGYEGMVKKPTVFLAGEKGSEYVSITPTDRASKVVPKTIIDIHDCEIYNFEDFVDQIKSADRVIAYERAA